MGKKFVSYNCVLYRVVTLFYVKEHMYCVTINQVVTLFWCKGTHLLCYYRWNCDTFLDVKEHMSCVTIDQTIVTSTIGTLMNMCYYET